MPKAPDHVTIHRIPDRQNSPGIGWNVSPGTEICPPSRWLGEILRGRLPHTEDPHWSWNRSDSPKIVLSSQGGFALRLVSQIEDRDLLRKGAVYMAAIKAKDFIRDLRSGMDDPTLMLRYELSHEGLQKVLEKLVEADFITVLELHERARLSETQVTRAFVDAQRAIDEID